MTVLSPHQPRDCSSRSLPAVLCLVLLLAGLPATAQPTPASLGSSFTESSVQGYRYGSWAVPGSSSATRKTAENRAAVPEIDPLYVSQAMKDFLAERIDDNMQRETRLRKLQESIFDPVDGLGITYGTHGTYSAAETFERAEGNCLSFTLLFVAMARHLGFITHFVEVDEVTGWSEQGGVSFNHWHMFAEVEMANGVVQVDFLPWSERRYRARLRIGEDRMRAHFYNNIGAQILTAGQGSEIGAMDYFRKALELDPTFTPATLNLAVAQRRAGLEREAEKNLLAILKTEPSSPQAATNLANLYFAQGRDADAERWVKKRNRLQRQNPFHHFRLGLRALQADRAGEARTHFRRAVVRQADEATFHQHLAEAQFRLGQISKARSSLERALELTDLPDRRRVIEAALLKLER